MKLVMGLLFFLLINPINGQTYSKEEVKKDLLFLKKQIKIYNPSLFAYNPDFERQSDSLIETAEAASIFKHFSLVSQLACFGNEGHFALGNWNDTVHSGFATNKYKYLPVRFKILGSRVFVMDEFTAKGQLQKGDEILEINGVSIHDILNQLYDVTPTDGNINIYQKHTIGVALNWMYYLYIDQPKRYDLSVVGYKNRMEKMVNIEAITLSDMRRNYKTKNATPTIQEETNVNEVYEFEIKENYAILTLKTFNKALLDRYDLKPSQLYKPIFKELKESGIKNLVIDVRNNNGGRKEYPNEIIAYLLKEKRKGVFATSISWKGRDRKRKLPKKSKYAFSGKLYVLINGQSFSSACTLARYAKEYGNAICIGEEGGTRYEGFSAGSKQYVNLPSSGLSIGIPRYWLKFPNSTLQTTQNRGLLPDYSINYSIEDILQERDLEMAKVLELIKVL